MLKNRYLLLTFLLLFFFLQLAAGQTRTSQWRLLWDANTEDDMSYYKIFRGTNPEPTTQIGTMQHPASEYVDATVQPGTRYYYRLKAVDETELESDFSEVVSAAIPDVSNIPDQLINQGNSFNTINLNNYVNDPDGSDNAITWTLTGSSNLSVSINSSRVATITAINSTWHGSENIIFRGTDTDEFFDEDAVIFTVNALPVITAIPNQRRNQGQPFQTIDLNYYVNDPDNPDTEMTWTANGNSELSVIISPSRIATVQAPNSSWYGSETITFRATDPHGAFTTRSVIFSVNATPVLETIPDQNINEGESFSSIDLKNHVTDPDHADSDIIWTFTGNSNLVVNINSNHLATITPSTASWYGTGTVTFTASDPYDAEASEAVNFKVNAGPEFLRQNLVDQSIYQGETFITFDLDSCVNDPDNSDAELSWSVNHTVNLSVMISNAHIVTITPKTTDWTGSETLTFVVSDPGGLQDSASVTFTIVGMNVPKINNLVDQYVNQGNPFGPLDLDNLVSDSESPDADLTWTISGENHLTITINDQRIAAISLIDPEWVGSDTIRFTVTDPEGNSTFQDVIFTVNGAPLLSNIPDYEIEQGQNFEPINLNHYVEDPNDPDNALSWSYSENKYVQISINSAAVATVTPKSQSWSGKDTVTFFVTDPGKLTAGQDVVFSIVGMSSPQILNIPGQIIVEGQIFNSINLDQYVNDFDSPKESLQWTFTHSGELDIEITENREAILKAPNSQWVGSDTVIFMVEDPQGNKNQEQAIYTINSIPVISNIPGQSIYSGESYNEINLDQYVSDKNNSNEDLTWTFTGNTNIFVSINANHIVQLTPKNGLWEGTEMITFTVTDPFGAQASEVAAFSQSNNATYTISVFTAESQTIIQGDAFKPVYLDSMANCPEQIKPELKWSCPDNENLFVQIDSVERMAAIHPKDADWFGSEEITFKVTTPVGDLLTTTGKYTILQNIYSTISANFMGSGTIIEFSWTTLVPVKGQISYGTDGLTKTSGREEQNRTDHRMIVSGLEPHTTYQFQAVGLDNAENEYTSKVIEIMTGAEAEINVFPNPYEAGKFADNDVINFANIPEGAKIAIFNLLGEPVFSQDDLRYLYRWDARNNHGKEIQAGLYIYVIKDADNKKLTSGKIVIIR